MTALDRALSTVALVGVVLLILTPLWLWRDMPDRVPIHFDPRGNPDGWGERRDMLLTPVVGLLMYAFLSVVARIPHLYNYPWPITEANCVRQYALARRLVLVMRLYVVVLFAWAFVATARVTSGASEGLGTLVLPVALGPIALILVGYLLAARRAR